MNRSSVAVRILLAFWILCAATAPAVGEDGSGSEEPQDVGLVEETGRRLLQVDLTLRGPAEALEGLTAEDLELVVGGRPIESFLLDASCIDSGPVAAPSRDPLRVEAAPETPGDPSGLTLLLFFDQLHLTAAGHHRSIEMARDLVDELVQGPSRATIISSADNVETFAELTSDREELLGALDRLAADATQYDSYANLEDVRVQTAYRALADAKAGRVNMEHVVFVVRQLQKEEQARTERALARFATVLERLAEANPPKAAIYFADHMRSNPGDHFWKMFDLSPDNATFGGSMIQVAHGASSPAYQQVVDVAASTGVRLYTVQAEGLVTAVNSSGIPASTLSDLSSDPFAGTRRFDDAENGLSGFALETGGRVFLGAAAQAGRIAEQIRSDLTCIYLISFDPEGLPENRALSVRIGLNRPKVEARYRSRLFVDSAPARRDSQLSHAFQGSGTSAEDSEMRVAVIPTGFKSGRYTALVQAIVPGSPLPETTWDVGLSTVFKGKVRAEPSGSVSVNRAGVPIIFESEIGFAPGPYEITAVAHETATGQVISHKIEGQWPDPGGDDPVVGPIALLQPATGAFVREGDQRTAGSLGFGPQDWIRPDRPTALVTIVCRGRGDKTDLLIERELEGVSTVEFEPLHVVDDRCAVLADRIEAGTMTSGAFVYAVSVSGHGASKTSTRREFLALAPQEIRLAGAD